MTSDPQPSPMAPLIDLFDWKLQQLLEQGVPIEDAEPLADQWVAGYAS